MNKNLKNAYKEAVILHKCIVDELCTSTGILVIVMDPSDAYDDAETECCDSDCEELALIEM